MNSTQTDLAVMLARLVLTAEQKKYRVIGVTAPTGGSGVSLLSSSLSAAFVNSGSPTALLDFSREAPVRRPTHPDSQMLPWNPNAAHDLSASLQAQTSAIKQPAATIDGLRSAWGRGYPDYRFIVLDLPPLLTYSHYVLSPLALAASCNAVIVTVMRGVTTVSELNQSLEQLHSLGCDVAALVVNGHRYVTPAEALSAKASKYLKFFPTAKRSIVKSLLSSSLLN